MKTLLLWRDKITRWFTSQNYGYLKTIFLVFSMVLTWFVTPCFERDTFIFWTAVGIFVYTLTSLYLTATVQIESRRVCLGWAFINASAFYTTASLLVNENEAGKSYVLPFLAGFTVITLLYRFSSYISYLLKLNDEKEDYSLWSIGKTKFNNCWFLIVIGIIFSICVFGRERRELEKYTKQKEYEQAVWINIKDWHTETIDGNTIYIINCSRGNVGVYPAHHPKIRNINSRTQIKPIGSPYQKYGLNFFDRLEIKN